MVLKYVMGISLVMQCIKKKKNLSTNAGDMGSTPGPGRSHAAEQLSPCVSTTEPKLQSLWVATTESTVTNTEP